MMKAVLFANAYNYPVQTIRSSLPVRRCNWNIDMPDAPFDYLCIHLPDSEEIDHVPSIDCVATQFIAGGGQIVRPKLTIPGVGSMITCEDAAGQLFSFLEEEHDN